MIRAIHGNILLQEVAGYLVQRQNIISSNIANINTPGYSRKELHFEKELQNEIENKRHNTSKTNGKHMSLDDEAGDDNDATIVESKDFNNVHGADRVDLDKEMSLMAKNTLMYNAVMTLIQKDFGGKVNFLSKVE